MVSDTGLISVNSFTRKNLGDLFSQIDRIPKLKTSGLGLLSFFEKSSRTRSSFETAGLELGLKWAYFELESSSLEKGESLEDHFSLFRTYPIHFTVLRHPQPGICQWVAQWTKKPVLNAGEGAYEHPTQALGDALSLYELSKTKKWKICFYGDVVKSRVARSSLHAFKKMGYEVFVCNDQTSETALFAKAYGVRLVSPKSLPGFDIIYALRTQTERGAQAHLPPVGLNDLGSKSKLMHAGPVIWGQDIQHELKFEEDRLLIQSQVKSCYRVRKFLLAELMARTSK